MRVLIVSIPFTSGLLLNGPRIETWAETLRVSIPFTSGLLLNDMTY